MKDMKLIMEGWRYQTGQTNFNILCENFDKGIISEDVLFETWHRRVLMEADEILTENLMDILKQGWEKGKDLAGKAKEVFDAAVEKVSDFFLKLCNQVFLLIERIKDKLATVAKSLGAIWAKVQKFCSAHPIICKIIKFVLLALAILAITVFIRNILQQDPSNFGLCENCITTYPDGSTLDLSQSGTDAIEGFLAIVAEDQSSLQDPGSQEAIVKAYNFVQECASSTNATQLADLGGQSGEILEKAVGIVIDINAENTDQYTALARLAEKVIKVNASVIEEIQVNGAFDTTSISFQQLKIKP